MMRKKEFTLCIPTLNPGSFASKLVTSIQNQSLLPNSILIIDSSSNDGSLVKLNALSPKIIRIDRKDFDHGGTRNIAFIESSDEIIIFLTQDAILAESDSLKRIYDAITENKNCALVYGRQLPAHNATPFAAHARQFNYPGGHDVQIKSANDISKLGIKTAFCSNSFAAYRRSAMERIGFFQEKTLFGEDALAAARLIREGFLLGYEPRACVYHSHNYSLGEEFRRYFDVGAFHSMNTWFLNYLGKAEGEGRLFVKSEFDYVVNSGLVFPRSQVLIRNGIRFLGYKMGRMQNKFPLFLNHFFSMNKTFWGKKYMTNNL